MLRALGIFCFLSIIRMSLLYRGYGDKSWTYTLLSVETKTSDPALVKWDLSIDRISRNVFGLSGTWFQNYDITDDIMFEVRFFRSNSGNSDYQEIPYSVKKRTFMEYVNTFYKDLIMTSLSNCSDFPQFEDKFEQPWPKMTFTLNQCQVSNEELPDHMQYGYYKGIFEATGGPEWTIEILAKVESSF